MPDVCNGQFAVGQCSMRAYASGRCHVLPCLQRSLQMHMRSHKHCSRHRLCVPCMLHHGVREAQGKSAEQEHSSSWALVGPWAQLAPSHYSCLLQCAGPAVMPADNRLMELSDDRCTRCLSKCSAGQHRRIAMGVRSSVVRTVVKHCEMLNQTCSSASPTLYKSS
jgi:hypothetical protein